MLYCNDIGDICKYIGSGEAINDYIKGHSYFFLKKEGSMNFRSGGNKSYVNNNKNNNLAFFLPG